MGPRSLGDPLDLCVPETLFIAAIIKHTDQSELGVGGWGQETGDPVGGLWDGTQTVCRGQERDTVDDTARWAEETEGKGTSVSMFGARKQMI